MAPARALCLYAGAQALRELRAHGLQPEQVGVVAGAAGGPKGLILGRLDRFLFADWLGTSTHAIDLVGASIGAWRMATACLDDPAQAFAQFEQGYIAQNFEVEPGRKHPTAQHVSERFAANLQAFFGARLEQVLQHPRWRVHVITARGRHVLRRERNWRTRLAFLGAYLSNAAQRRALGGWLERVVFSSGAGAPDGVVDPAVPQPLPELPFDSRDYRTRQVRLNAHNFMPALQASCTLPFLMQAVHDIAAAPPGAYWDGGLTDYHLHLNWRPERGLVLYPHFQRELVPGWFDKAWRARHRSTPWLDRTLVLAPHPDWVRQRLPNAKLPDRNDFERYRTDYAARVRDWSAAAAASQQLADEFAAWVQRPDPSRIEPL